MVFASTVLPPIAEKPSLQKAEQTSLTSLYNYTAACLLCSFKESELAEATDFITDKLASRE